MLGKLIKYDLKWVYKLIIVFYALSIFFSIAGRIFLEMQNSVIFNVLAQICLGVAIAMIINCLINNLMRMWVRFIRNTYKDESYLTHTLPVSKKTIYLSKVLSGILSMLLTVVVIIVCVAICFYSQENLQGFNQFLEITAANYEISVMTFLITVFIAFFLEMVFALLSGFLGIIVGHQSNHYKMVKSAVFGFLFYLIPQILTVLIIFMIGFFNQGIMNLFTTANMISMDAIKTIMISGIIIYAVYNVMYYLIGKKQLEKGVNVD